jgi:hypothetical protein
MGGGAARAIGGALGDRVGYDLPIARRVHRERVAGLEVGLVEAGEQPLGVGRLELRVQIDAAVDRVDEAVQALAGVRVATRGDDRQLVVRGEVGQGDALVLAVAGDIQLSPVEHRRPHARAHEVDPAAGTRFSTGEADRRGDGVGRLAGPTAAVGEVDLDGVVSHVQQRGPPLGLDSCQIRRCHGVPGPFSPVIRPEPTHVLRMSAVAQLHVRGCIGC